MQDRTDTMPKYLETLLLYYEEEIMGEAYFRGLVERVAAESVWPLLDKYRLTPRPDRELKKAGEASIEQHKDFDWRALMVDMAERYPGYLDDFQALENAAPAEDRAAIRVMTEHEVAAIDFAKLEIEGDRRSAEVLRRYIDSTLSKSD